MAVEDISLTIDGRRVSVPPGATLLDAAAAAGLDVPTLCFHPNIAASANCRLCVVEQSLSPNEADAEPPPGARNAKPPSCCPPAARKPSLDRSSTRTAKTCARRAAGRCACCLAAST